MFLPRSPTVAVVLTEELPDFGHDTTRCYVGSTPTARYEMHPARYRAYALSFSMSSTDIQQRCVELAKNEIETLADYARGADGYNSLDIEYTVSAQGDIKEITVTTATGGPHVEVELVNGVVSVSWGSDNVRRVIRDSEAKDACQELAELYESTAQFT